MNLEANLHQTILHPSQSAQNKQRVCASPLKFLNLNHLCKHRPWQMAHLWQWGHSKPSKCPSNCISYQDDLMLNLLPGRSSIPEKANTRRAGSNQPDNDVWLMFKSHSIPTNQMCFCIIENNAWDFAQALIRMKCLHDIKHLNFQYLTGLSLTLCFACFYMVATKNQILFLKMENISIVVFYGIKIN